MIVKRLVKGSTLTYTELDNNFTELEASLNETAKRTTLIYTPSQVNTSLGVISIAYSQALIDKHGSSPSDVKVWFDNKLQPVTPVLDIMDNPTTITLDLGTIPSTNTKIIII